MRQPPTPQSPSFFLHLNFPACPTQGPLTTHPFSLCLELAFFFLQASSFPSPIPVPPWPLPVTHVCRARLRSVEAKAELCSEGWGGHLGRPRQELHFSFLKCCAQLGTHREAPSKGGCLAGSRARAKQAPTHPCPGLRGGVQH